MEARDEVDFKLNLNEATAVARIQSYGRSETVGRMPLLELVILSPEVKAKCAFMEELGVFKQDHISFGRGLGPRTGIVNSAREITLYHFYRQAFLASQWSQFRVLA